MQEMGLIARIRRQRKYASYQGDVGKKATNLINRQFEGAKPDEKCYTDVTEFALPEGKLYLSPVLDGYNKVSNINISPIIIFWKLRAFVLPCLAKAIALTMR